MDIMAEVTSAAPGPRQRRHWLRSLGWLAVLVIVLCIVLYFVVSSPAFLKKQILPRISKSLNANVTVSSAVVNPFSQIVLRDLKIQPTNQPPLVTAREIRMKCSLFDLLAGNIRVDEADLVSPVFQFVENVDGTSNLEPLRKASQQKAKQPAKPSAPPQIDIRKVILSDATFRRIQNQKAGTRNLVELTNVDLTVTGLRNGGSGKLEFTSIVRDENNPPAPAMYGLLRAEADGTFDFGLTPELNLRFILGDARVNISQAAGSFSDFSKLNGTLHCDVSSTEFRTVALSFEKNGSRLGELRATGPYDAQKAEGRLSVELLSVDKQVLNLFGARYGIDFGSTTITSTNEIELTKAGAAIAASGQLTASKFQLSRTNESTPPLEVRADYNVSVDKVEKTALLRALNLTGSQDGRLLLRGELTSPMTLAWGNASNAVGDSSLNIAISRLKISDWKSFAGNLASAGTLDLNMKLLSQRGGTELTFDATNRIENIATQIGGQHISDASAFLWARGRATNLNQFNLRQYSLQLVQSNQTALAISGSGFYDRSNSSVDLQVTLDAFLPRALRLLNRADVTASSGTAELKARVTQKHQTQTVDGNLTLSKFTGKFAKNQFTNFGATADLNLEKNAEQIVFHKAAGQLTGIHGPGGSFEFSGTCGLANRPSQFTVNVSDFNEDGLRPFLEPLLAKQQLASVTLNGTASMQLSPRGSSALKADVQLSNLVMTNAARATHTTPLAAKVELDVAAAKQIIDIHQLQIALTPTLRATNQLQIVGRVDRSKTNSIQGHLKLTANALDLTSYYDLFSATNKPIVTARSGGSGRSRTQSASGTTPPPQPAREFATNQLPFTNFTVDANVREIYLREVAGSNFQATVKLDGSHILLKPFQLVMDRSPVLASADVDMSVPGWKYALILNVTNVPFAPLWNTFNPERKGEVGGTLTAYGDINGTGTSGETLQKTLTGNFHVGTTNLNLYAGTVHNRMLLGVLGVIASVQEIISNPLDAALNLVGNAISGKLTGGLSPDVQKSPIDVIAVHAIATNGQIVVQHALVRSAVFEATTSNATITLAPMLTNSPIEIPIGIALSSAVVPRISGLNLMNTQTNNNYVKLPDFFSERGTIGNPKRNIDVIALTKAMVKEAVSNVGIGTNDLVHPLQGIGDLLHTEAGRNQTTTNQVPANNLFNRPVRPISK